MTDEKAIRSTMLELIEIAKRAFNAHLQTGTGGNISARVVGSDAVVIKPSGVGFSACTPDNLLVVDLEGKILRGSTKPSKDIPFHLGIYRVRSEVNGLVHVHAPWATAWAVLGEEIPTLTVQSRSKFGKIPLVPSGERTEFGHLGDTLLRYALARPEIHLSLRLAPAGPGVAGGG